MRARDWWRLGATPSKVSTPCVFVLVLFCLLFPRTVIGQQPIGPTQNPFWRSADNINLGQIRCYDPAPDGGCLSPPLTAYGQVTARWDYTPYVDPAGFQYWSISNVQISLLVHDDDHSIRDALELLELAPIGQTMPFLTEADLWGNDTVQHQYEISLIGGTAQRSPCFPENYDLDHDFQFTTCIRGVVTNFVGPVPPIMYIGATAFAPSPALGAYTINSGGVFSMTNPMPSAGGSGGSPPGGSSGGSASGGSCPAGDGLYCGGDGIGGDRNTLYQCTSGNIAAVQACSNGCKYMPAGTSDICSAASAPPGGDMRQFLPRPNSNGQWDAWDATALGAAVQVAGKPFPFQNSVYVRDVNGVLRQFMPRPNTNGLWDAWDLSYGNGIRIAGDPVVDSGGSVFVRDTAGVLRQFMPRPNSGGQWDAWDLSYGNGVRIAGNPALDGRGSVFVRDTAGVLRQFLPRPNSGGQWDAWDLSYGNGVLVAGDPAVNSSGVFVRDTAGVLRQFLIRPNGGGTWDAWPLTYGNDVLVAGNPALDGKGSVFVRDTGGVLRQFMPRPNGGGTWDAWPLTYGNDVLVAGNPALDGKGSVFVRDTGGVLRQFMPRPNGGGTWDAWPLTYGNNVLIDGDPALDKGSGIWVSGK